MKEIVMTMTSKGQVTIPAQVRHHLGLKKNQKIALVIEDKGTVRLKVPRYPTVASIRGAAGTLVKRLSWKETREIACEERAHRKTAHK